MENCNMYEAPAAVKAVQWEMSSYHMESSVPVHQNTAYISFPELKNMMENNPVESVQTQAFKYFFNYVL